jgi:DNA-binding MarR family transcriptional regulator/predicted N-acetyltransferase YhbS
LTSATILLPYSGIVIAVDAVRRFNRVYTRRLGLLERGLLESDLSLTEVRMLYELAQGATNARALCDRLGIDPGYASRILAGFARNKLVTKTPSRSDGRQIALALTKKGHATFAELDARAAAQVTSLLETLPPARQERFVTALREVTDVLEPEAEPMIVLRSHRPGELGWVVERHGALYAQEYGWDARFEALVAKIVAGFGTQHDPRRERCWIAELGGVPVGCIFLVAKTKRTAQLRLFLVEPTARGRGIGERLVGECVRFAKDAGYTKIVLWTNSVLHAARRLYERAGFRLAGSERTHMFGHALVSQTWELVL